MSKRPPSPEIVVGAYVAPKKPRAHIAKAPTLDSWLKPNAPPLLLASSPHLHSSDSTFVGFTYSFVPPCSITTTEGLAKAARRIVKELDVVSLIGPELISRNEGAFQDGAGRFGNRAREPDHRMWAVRTICLKPGKDGTGGEEDYQLLEACDDDGEKYGGERILRVLVEQGGIDVLTVVCRWFGGQLLGPARFHHIGVTAQHSLSELQRLVTLRDLRAEIVNLDAEIGKLRAEVNQKNDSSAKDDTNDKDSKDDSTPTSTPARVLDYEDIEDIPRLQRLLRAKEKSKENLQSRVHAP